MTPQSKPDQSQADGRQNRQAASQQPIKRNVPDPADSQRASRSETVDRVEIKDFDIGRSAAEVVGTVDVVQRFDNNADGRIDLLESQRATRARDTSSTYAARGQARSETSNVAEQVQQQEIQRSFEPQVRQNAESQAPAPTVAEEQASAPLKKFGDPQVLSGGASDEGTVLKKFVSSEEISSQGSFSDGAPVEQKFYGEGAEVVIGRFAADTDGAQKFSDRAAQAETGRFYEDGTGEQKFYDKVAQSEAGRFAPEDGGQKYYDGAEDLPSTAGSGEGQPDASLYEKAQQVAAQTGGHDGAGQEPKKLYGELELYSDVAGYGEEPAIIGEPDVEPVTV